jgi:KUP system potassium uptake protein
VTATAESVYGLLSLVFWSVTVIVTVLYVGLVLRADNHGEGGILSLITLLPGQRSNAATTFRRRTPLILAALGVFGASLFLADSMITPAISVLSAVEGLRVVNPELEPLVIPLTVVIILVLFTAQRLGTAKVARLFGPIMTLWFVSIGIAGASGIATDPGVLRVLSPTYAIGFFVADPASGFFAMAAGVLAITGAEALYADLGHFGRRPITIGWLALVYPACTLSYLGQGASILADPDAIRAPFFLLAPSWAQLPMVLLATAATVIASQAVITGAFSVARQAVQLGYLPRLRILHCIAHVTIPVGYMESADVPAVLDALPADRFESAIDIEHASYFLSTIDLGLADADGPPSQDAMSAWRQRIFIATSALTADAAEYFNLPGDRTVIIGSRISL